MSPFDCPDVPSRKLRPKIILSDTTNGGPLNAVATLNTDDRIAPDVLRDLVDRNPPGQIYSLRDYRPGNPDVSVLPKSTFISRSRGFDGADEYFDVKGYVVVALPGYSRDGLTAVVRFTFGPWDHISLGYYRLDKVDGHWAVRSRLLYYGS
jgi:hypothetical protein